MADPAVASVALDGAAAGGPPAFSARQLRDAFGAFATGVTIVTARDAAGRPVGMTVNSFSAVSLDPPLLLWCAQRGVPPYEVFAGAGHFAVHVLDAGQRALADRFAGAFEDRFAGVAVEPGLAGLPLIAGCPTRLQCAVVQRHAGGDHLILLGRLLAADHRPAAPLLFHAGRYLAA